MNKLPAIQWYPGDWWRDLGVQSLTCEERGAWFQILMLMHDSERRGYLVLNGRKPDDDTLANILNMPLAKLQQTASKIVANGVASLEQDTGILFCRRMVRDEDLRKIKAKSGQAGGRQKASNRSSKNLANSTPSVSSSSSSSFSNTKNTCVFDVEKFETFWSEYPRKINKVAARKAWSKLDWSNGLYDKVITAIKTQRDCQAWRKDGGQFIPHPASWLNGRRWEDEVPRVKTTLETLNELYPTNESVGGNEYAE